MKINLFQTSLKVSTSERRGGRIVNFVKKVDERPKKRN